MILKGSQRGGSRQLATHLLNERDNDHVTVHELRGFVAGDLHGAMSETHAVAKGTRCRQPVFSLSLNPPKDASVGLETLLEVVDRAEETLGLVGQPRAVVVHEKNGRRHAHVVWSRIDADGMKAINLPHFKNRLRELSKELYLEHGWSLPDGHRTNGWKNPLNFTLAEWQQAKRLELDPREIKMIFREAWERSDNLASFRRALEERGYFLAQGDRRGFVALDIQGEVFAVARWAGVKTKELGEKLGKPDRLPSLEQARLDTRKQMSKQMRSYITQQRETGQQQSRPLHNAKVQMVKAHRLERSRLEAAQKKRFEAEAKIRAGQFRRGLGAVMDLLSGRVFKQRKENERQAFDALKRDARQREALFEAQHDERQALQQKIDALALMHRQQRTAVIRRVVEVMRMTRPGFGLRRDEHRLEM